MRACLFTILPFFEWITGYRVNFTVALQILFSNLRMYPKSECRFWDTCVKIKRKGEYSVSDYTQHALSRFSEGQINAVTAKQRMISVFQWRNTMIIKA